MGRIIVIEDNPVFAGYVCGLLESKGFQSVSTSTCNGARKLFSKVREDDIVLADLRLPDGDGIALLEELRRQGMNNPYIVMTDYDEVPTAVRSMKSGAEDYIPKPLIEANLFPLLKTLQKRTERHDTPIYERQSAAFREIDRRIRLVAPDQHERIDIRRKRNRKGTHCREDTREEQTGRQAIRGGGLRPAFKGACRLRPVRT